VTEGIIVEVQRFAGCGFEFQSTVRELFRAAKSGEVPTISARSFPIPRSLPKLPEIEWEVNTKEALDMAAGAFKQSNRVDSHALAMESIAQLSSNEFSRTFCAKFVLSPKSEVLPIIIALVQKSGSSEHYPSESLLVSLDDCYQCMHRDAVNTLSNCLQSLHMTKDMNESMWENLPSLSCDATLSALVKDVSAAEVTPHDAAASCRCLHLLCKFNNDIKQVVLDLGVVGYVSTAAKCRHTILQQETVRLMSIL
jgi:hypothetical protein